MGELTQPNAELYRDWQRKRAGEGYKELPRNEFALKSLQEHAGGRVLTALTRADIQEWVAALGGMAPSSRASYWSAARAFYNWASSEEEEIIGRSPMARMKEPKNPDRPVPVPSLDAVRLLVGETEKDRSPMGRRDTALIRVLCDTGGPRAAEAAGLLISGRRHPAGTPEGLGVDLTRDSVTAEGKGGHVRTWPISKRTATAVTRWMRVRDTLRLSHTHSRLWHTFHCKNVPLTVSGVESILRKRCDAAGTPRLHPHQLRHFAYHQFLLAGGRENDAMILFGWKNDQMPRRYARALAAERALQAGNTLAIGDNW
jgi:site-specific recombinase XerD